MKSYKHFIRYLMIFNEQNQADLKRKIYINLNYIFKEWDIEYFNLSSSILFVGIFHEFHRFGHFRFFGNSYNFFFNQFSNQDSFTLNWFCVYILIYFIFNLVAKKPVLFINTKDNNANFETEKLIVFFL